MLKTNTTEKFEFENVSTGDNCLDVIFFIQNIFEQKQLTKEEKQRVLAYVMSVVNS